MSALRCLLISLRKINVPNTLKNVTKTQTPILAKNFHATARCWDLMEFFEPKDNWGKDEVKSGQEWTKDMLRIKSNQDLHKLWFVLYKERNMLLTMEQAYKNRGEPFPNPERLFRMEESMVNLEAVVRERNLAYTQLECGKSLEQEVDVRMNLFGHIESFNKEEHELDRDENPNFQEPDHLIRRFPEVTDFIKKVNERNGKHELKKLRAQSNYIRRLLRRVPDTDIESLRHNYPDINVDSIVKSMKFKIRET